MTAARVASDALTRALITAASKGLRPHCSDAGTGGLRYPSTKPKFPPLRPEDCQSGKSSFPACAF